MKKLKDAMFVILILCVMMFVAQTIVYNGMPGYWYFTATEKIDDRGEKYLYVNDSVKVIYLKKDSLKHYKGEIIVVQNGKVMARTFAEVTPSKWGALNYLRYEYKQELSVRKRRMSNFLAN